MKKHIIALALFAVLPSSSMAAPLWSDIAASQAETALAAKQSALEAKSRRVLLDYEQLKATLAPATALSAWQVQKDLNTAQIDLPMPYGGLQTFNVYESSVMAPELAAKYPQIKTYKVVAANDPAVTGVLDTGPKGFHAYLNTAEGEMFINPASSSTQTEYYSLYKHDYASTTPRKFSCGVQSKKSASASPVEEFKAGGINALARTSDTIKTYRIAVAATSEYSDAVKQPGSTTVTEIKADASSEIVTAINRVSFIYERDLAIRLLMVNNDSIIYTSADLLPDPYTNNSASALLDENQNNLNSAIGAANYDIGHVFSTGGGGLAWLASACDDANKARGETGLPDPTGEVFHIDYVAHEIGHQLGANHTFNGSSGSCGGNRNAATAYEPGSGSTIMGYAGICSPENTSDTGIATFHAGSIAEIINNVQAIDAVSLCGGSVSSTTAPVADVGVITSYTIPGGTPFTLTGSATDVDVTDVLTYQWDQMDAGMATTSTTYGLDIGSNALFRSFIPSDSSTRTFPQLQTLWSNVPDKAETLPTENRTLNFRFTVRDDNGGVDEDDMQVVVDGTKGPFEVLSLNTTGIILKSGSGFPQLIEWNKACTDAAPVNCAYVDILLSTDDGSTFTSVVGGSTPNDGNQQIILPDVDTTTARIKIACTDNVFFDISNVNFEISTTGGGTLTTLGIAETCGTEGNAIATDGNDTFAEAQSIAVPTTTSGTVNDVFDPDDYFVFVATTSTYTITLSNYGGNDLDLYLYDSNQQVLGFSESYTDPTESIVQNVTAGSTYYIQVSGWNTFGQDSSYTLSVQEGGGGGGGGMISYYWLIMLAMTPLLRLRQKD